MEIVSGAKKAMHRFDAVASEARMKRGAKQLSALSAMASRALAMIAVMAAVGGFWAATDRASAQNLTIADVNQIIAQAQQEANVRALPATIAVVDRVGNVLAVYQMPGAPATVTVTSGRAIGTGIDGLAGVVPASLGAIAKAITGAYLSSGGNAFTTRTASQIVQEHFNPGEDFAPSGPLFGVQFSQLPCSDLSRRFINAAAPVPADQFRGPKRSPLGLSADPGGLPLYKGGVPVGGIGIVADGIYGLDTVTSNIDSNPDEIIALAGTVGFDAPRNIRADRIFVEGKSFRYTDVDTRALVSTPATAPAPTPANFVAVTGYTDGAPIAGQVYGTSASGIRAINTVTDGAAYTNVANITGLNPFLLVSGADIPYFPIIAGAPNGGQNLTVNDVSTIIGHALRVAFSGRAQIRRPLQSSIQVTVSVVDTEGQVLGQARTPDGPLFGIDVSLQKARTAALISNPNAAANLENPQVFPVIQLTANALNGLIPGHNYNIPNYVRQVQAFIGPNALQDGTAFADRSGGNLSRPFFPDGVDTNGPGPLSRPIGNWSPFSTGMQLDLVVPNILNHILFVLNLNIDITGDGVPDFDPDGDGFVNDTGFGCSPIRSVTSGLNPLANGLQIFPGSVPIFKNGALVGGIGVSGDGVDQDDMISFLGLHNAGVALANGVGNAPSAIRADGLRPNGVRLRYVSCPFAPFLGSREQNVCEGK